MSASQTLIIVGALLLLHGGDAKTFKPASSAELQSAFDSAAAYDTIEILPITYKGDFVISRNGPCTLHGVNNSTIQSQGIGIHLKGSQWNLNGFVLQGPIQGILIEGSNNVLEAAVIQNCGRGVAVKGDSNTISKVVVSATDIGINFDGSRNNLLDSTVNAINAAIVIPRVSCCGYVRTFVANAKINLDGSSYRFEWGVATSGLYVNGCNNAFRGCTAMGHSFPSCGIINDGENAFM